MGENNKKLGAEKCDRSNFYFDGCLHANILKPQGAKRSFARSS